MVFLLARHSRHQEIVRGAHSMPGFSVIVLCTTRHVRYSQLFTVATVFSHEADSLQPHGCVIASAHRAPIARMVGYRSPHPVLMQAEGSCPAQSQTNTRQQWHHCWIDSCHYLKEMLRAWYIEQWHSTVKMTPFSQVENTTILRKVTSFRSWKIPQFSGDIVSPECLHRCYISWLMEAQNPEFLPKKQIFFENFKYPPNCVYMVSR